MKDQLRLRRAGEAYAVRSSRGVRVGPPDLVMPEAIGEPRRGWTLKRVGVSGVVALTLAAGLTTYLHQRELAYQASAHNERLERQIAALQQGDAQDRGTIAALTEIKDAMAARLATGERRRRRVAAERDRALQRVRTLQRQLEARDARLKSMVDHSAGLSDQLAVTGARLIEIGDQREADQRAEASLRWRLASIQTQLEREGARRAQTQNLIEGWVFGNVATLEELVSGTGVDLETLVERAAVAEHGQGGPFEAMSDQHLQELPLQGSVADDILRLSALRKLTSSLPLGSPLDQFHITSTYGKRHDPFTKGWAFHGGLDMGAPPSSKVLATAPGIVLVAGPSGPYGNMVEIDHGMGVITRFGHLDSVAVAVGDQVAFRQQVGVIGSSGRSTSVHLHYEVRVDGALHDPGRFLDAGRYLVAVFDLGERGMEWLQVRSGDG